jgi:hypothetical protein
MFKLRKINKSWKLTASQTPMEQRKNLVNVKQYLAKIGAKGGKAKSAAKTAAARKANAARWRNHKPKRVTAQAVTTML